MGERRKLHRLEVSIPCQFQGPRSTHDGRVTNLSTGGAFVEAQICPHPGALLKVSLEPEPGRRIEASALVVHRGFFDDMENRGEGFGITFQDFEGDSRKALEEFVHSVTG